MFIPFQSPEVAKFNRKHILQQTHASLLPYCHIPQDRKEQRGDRHVKHRLGNGQIGMFMRVKQVNGECRYRQNHSHHSFRQDGATQKQGNIHRDAFQFPLLFPSVELCHSHENECRK